jgi:hypothetical protein
LDVMRWRPTTLRAKVFDDHLKEVRDIDFKVKPALFNAALRVQDLAVMNIIYKEGKSRGIYFAVTVSEENKIGLKNYLRMDGLAYRLAAGSEPVVQDRLSEKLFKTFRYETIRTDKLGKDWNC